MSRFNRWVNSQARTIFSSVLWVLLWAIPCMPARSAAVTFFKISVVDAETGRGVPLVELRTVNSVRYVTDSRGVIAFQEPGLMNQEVFFHVQSHGYEYPKDGFGNSGLKLKVTGGGSAEIKLKRLNIAERLYRITGEGIYRDSALLGEKVPLKKPLLNGQVLGQDSVVAARYHNKIYWFWGDTDKASYPLGNFSSSGATSGLPGTGGLDPNDGVDLTYFVDQTGFSKPMCPNFGKGLQWMECLMTLRDANGGEKLVARVATVPGLAKPTAWHLALFNDQKEAFESLVRWDVHEPHDVTQPFRTRVGGNEYFYLYPDYRVKADLQSVTNLAAYEAFTCLEAGTQGQFAVPRIDRDTNGKPHYAWRTNAGRIDVARASRLLKPGENWKLPHDLETGLPINLTRGSVSWNDYRRRWVMISAGSAGEIWFTEADTPVGPWVYSRRVVSHDHYNFYNPSHHSFFDQEGGRLIYFEGTYTASFSGAKEKTPRYDYNQIMYRLALGDPRLALPAPVYAVRQPNGTTNWMMRDEVERTEAWQNVQSIPFFAVPPNRKRSDLVPVYAIPKFQTVVLQSTPPTGANAEPIFLGMPLNPASIPARVFTRKPPQNNPQGTDSPDANSSALVTLVEYRHNRSAARLYALEDQTVGNDWLRSSTPPCRVWRNPTSLLLLDHGVKPLADATR